VERAGGQRVGVTEVAKKDFCELAGFAQDALRSFLLGLYAQRMGLATRA
jgi:hypothetical protein